VTRKKQATPKTDQPAAAAEAAPAATPAKKQPSHRDASADLEAYRETVEQGVSDLLGQQAYMRQQVNQLHAAVSQLYQAVGGQCQQLLQSDTALQQELLKLQSGGAQRAMAGIYNKLFRELLVHMNHLDDLVAAGDTMAGDEAITPWVDAVRVARDHLQETLSGWGCRPMELAVGVAEFDPEIHQALPAMAGDVPEGMAEHLVAKVKRRGWLLHEEILQYPQVVVS
jgi:molecular chaperone GrpE (heat shock protein)